MIPEQVDRHRELSKRSLANFIRLAWPIIEPRELIWGWHIDCICEHLEAVTKGEINNLIINIPPGHMKTLSVNVLWPAWEWTFDPGSKWITSSYAQTLSDKSARTIKMLINSGWYQDRWPLELTAESVRIMENEKGGRRLSTSVGGTVTGFHADRIIFDDLVKVAEATLPDSIAVAKANEFWFTTMETRNASSSSARVGVMQRLCVGDTADKCIESGDYVNVILPARFVEGSRLDNAWFRDPRKEEGEPLWPERMPEEALDRIKRNLTASDWRAQYQQDPVPATGSIFEAGWLIKRDKGPTLKESTVIASWDPTFTDGDSSDYMAGFVIAYHQNKYWIIDRSWAKRSFRDAARAVLAMHEKWPQITAHCIEATANGAALIDTLSTAIPVKKIKVPANNKVERALTVTPSFDAGSVIWPDEDWVDDCWTEFLSFPRGKHDDQVDALVQGIRYLHEKHASGYVAGLGAIDSLMNSL